jgi:hypothetical protein
MKLGIAKSKRKGNKSLIYLKIIKIMSVSKMLVAHKEPSSLGNRLLGVKHF